MGIGYVHSEAAMGRQEVSVTLKLLFTTTGHMPSAHTTASLTSWPAEFPDRHWGRASGTTQPCESCNVMAGGGGAHALLIPVLFRPWSPRDRGWSSAKMDLHGAHPAQGMKLGVTIPRSPQNATPPATPPTRESSLDGFAGELSKL